MSGWPVYDTPQQVEDAFGTFTETIVSGAADHAKPLPGERSMVVARDEWNADFSERRVLEIAAIGRGGK